MSDKDKFTDTVEKQNAFIYIDMLCLTPRMSNFSVNYEGAPCHINPKGTIIHGNKLDHGNLLNVNMLTYLLSSIFKTLSW